MPLFGNSKKTVQNTSEQTTIQAASDGGGGAFAVQSGGVVNYQETDHGSVNEAIKLATSANEDVRRLAERGIETAAAIAERSNQTTRDVLATSAGQINTAIGAITENNQTTEDRGLQSIVTIAAIAGLAFVGAKFFGGIK